MQMGKRVKERIKGIGRKEKEKKRHKRKRKQDIRWKELCKY